MKNEFFRCSICGRFVEVLESGQGPLVCCGQDMEKVIPNTVDAAIEKHVPVIEKTESGYKIKVGSSPHPMIDEHYIMWVEIQTESGVLRQELKPGDEPEAEFCTKAKEIKAYAYCNIHGLWVSE